MEKALAANKAGDDTAVKTHQRKMQMIQGKMQKLKQNEEVELGEECEILAELDKKTLGNYVKKAHDQLMKHTSSVNFKGGRGDSDAFAYAHDPVAVRKTANRTKGMDQAINKLTKEEVEEFMQTEAYEQLDELDKDTLKSYIGKASQNARIQGMMQMDYKHKGDKARNPGTKKAYDKMSDDARSKGWKRQDGIKTAVNKLAKEEVEELDELSKDTLKSYVKKSDKQADKLSDKYSTQRMKRDKSHGQFSDDTPELEKLGRKIVNRETGVDRANKKLNKEDNMLTYSEFMAQLSEGKADDLRDKLAADREARLNNYDRSEERV
jgi:hypothetical protein